MYTLGFKANSIRFSSLKIFRFFVDTAVNYLFQEQSNRESSWIGTTDKEVASNPQQINTSTAVTYEYSTLVQHEGGSEISPHYTVDTHAGPNKMSQGWCRG